MKSKVGWIIQSEWLRRQKDGRKILAILNRLDIPYQRFNWSPDGSVFYQWDQQRHGRVAFVGLIGEIAFMQLFHRRYAGPPLQTFHDTKMGPWDFRSVIKELEHAKY